MENSFHHQSVDKIGEGLRLNAVAKDGTAKGFEADPAGIFRDKYIVGVQWHPEFGASEASTKIIGDLVEHAKKHMHDKPLPTLNIANSVCGHSKTRTIAA
jgi:putative glutamine amidotransferase